MHLSVAFFANAGSWSMFNRQFQFRWDGETTALAGFESSDVHRGSGGMRRTSVNYLTGRRKDAIGNITEDTDDWKWSDLPKDAKTALGSIGNGFEFEP